MNIKISNRIRIEGEAETPTVCGAEITVEIPKIQSVEELVAWQAQLNTKLLTTLRQYYGF